MQRYCILLLFLVLTAGCSRQEATDRAKELTGKAGRAIGEGAGTFFSGVGEGYEKAVTAYDVRIADELKARGLSVSVAKHNEGSATNTLSLYVINKQAVAGALRIRLFSAATQEIGRATAAVSLPTDNGQYVPFGLDKQIPLSLTKFIELDLKKE